MHVGEQLYSRTAVWCASHLFVYVCVFVPGLVISRLGRRRRIAGTPGNCGKFKFIHLTIHTYSRTHTHTSTQHDMDWNKTPKCEASRATSNGFSTVHSLKKGGEETTVIEGVTGNENKGGETQLKLSLLGFVEVPTHVWGKPLRSQ